MSPAPRNASPEPAAPLPLLTADEVAKLLSCSVRHVWALRRRRKLVATRLGYRCTRFARADVETLLANARNSHR